MRDDGVAGKERDEADEQEEQASDVVEPSKGEDGSASVVLAVSAGRHLVASKEWKRGRARERTLGPTLRSRLGSGLCK